MTMIPNILRADHYCIKITKEKGQINPSENEMFLFEYREGYDKDNKDHQDAFEHIEQVKDFNEQSLSAYGNASVDFDRESMTISLVMTAPFEKLANFVSMEFLTSGSLGKITLLEFISMAASSIVASTAAVCDKDDISEDNADCKGMYA
jgi:hypothetical protein